MAPRRGGSAVPSSVLRAPVLRWPRHAGVPRVPDRPKGARARFVRGIAGPLPSRGCERVPASPRFSDRQPWQKTALQSAARGCDFGVAAATVDIGLGGQNALDLVMHTGNDVSGDQTVTHAVSFF